MPPAGHLLGHRQGTALASVAIDASNSFPLMHLGHLPEMVRKGCGCANWMGLG